MDAIPFLHVGNKKIYLTSPLILDLMKYSPTADVVFLFLDGETCTSCCVYCKPTTTVEEFGALMQVVISFSRRYYLNVRSVSTSSQGTDAGQRSFVKEVGYEFCLFPFFLTQFKCFFKYNYRIT